MSLRIEEVYGPEGAFIEVTLDRYTLEALQMDLSLAQARRRPSPRDPADPLSAFPDPAHRRPATPS